MTGSKKLRIAGWVLSVLVAALFIFMSAPMKFSEWEGKEKAFEEMGYKSDVMFKIGIVEVAAAVLFLIPQTGFLGAILLTGYLGGATATHVRIGQPFIIPVIIGVVVWIAYGLRRPEVFKLLYCSRCAPASETP